MRNVLKIGLILAIVLFMSACKGEGEVTVDFSNGVIEFIKNSNNEHLYLYVDHKKKTEILHDGAITLKLSEGNHEISLVNEDTEFQYTTTYVKKINVPKDMKISISFDLQEFFEGKINPTKARMESIQKIYTKYKLYEDGKKNEWFTSDRSTTIKFINDGSIVVYDHGKYLIKHIDGLLKTIVKDTGKDLLLLAGGHNVVNKKDRPLFGFNINYPKDGCFTHNKIVFCTDEGWKTTGKNMIQKYIKHVINNGSNNKILGEISMPDRNGLFNNNTSTLITDAEIDAVASFVANGFSGNNAGAKVFAGTCAVCHGADGKGMDMVAPSLNPIFLKKR